MLTGKKGIRAHALAARKRLPLPSVRELSAAVAKRVLELDCVVTAPAILSYIGGVHHEVETLPILHALLDRGKSVYAPCIAGKGLLTWRRLPGAEYLVTGAYGIPEPDPQRCPEDTIPADAPVFVPCVAFTDEGHRLGYGGGYFDKFLATHRGPAVGLAFDEQQVDGFPVEDHDRALSYIVTPSRVLGPFGG